MRLWWSKADFANDGLTSKCATGAGRTYKTLDFPRSRPVRFRDGMAIRSWSSDLDRSKRTFLTIGGETARCCS